MILKSLEIQGFKSFPDKTVLSFTEGITAVVGPNGSGKSNISDAIRWVLGEQSTKTLRGGKMEDVIFSGTSNRMPQGFAEVKLVIDNSDGSLPVEEQEVVIARKYYRSGESEYLINNKTVRLKDIYELFMDTGLGRDGYSCIGQGRIAEIVAAKSEDRREIFEEASGISKYRYRKEQAQKRLALAEENLLRLRDIFTELESRVGPLKEQSDKANRFIELNSEREELEIGLLLINLNKLKEKLRDIDYKITLCSSQKEEVEESLSETTARLEAISLEMAELSAEIEKNRQLCSSYEEQAIKKESEAAIKENDILHIDENISRVNEDINLAGRQTEAIDQEIKEKEAAIEEKNKYIEEKRGEHKSLLEEFERAADREKDYSSNLSRLNQELSAAILDITKSEAELNAAIERKQELDIQLKESDAFLAEQKAKSEQLEKALEENLNKSGELEEKITELANTVKGYEYKFSQKNQKLKAVTDNRSKLALQLEQKNQKAAMLEDMEKHMEGFSNSVKVIMNQSKRGIIRGVHGTVSQIIRVDDRYAVAIETALGSALQHIIVDDEATAKRAIESLKQSNSGRATFLPLSNIKGSRINESGLNSKEGFLGIAGELVKADNEYKEIIDSLLGRIIVADDLNNAAVIAKAYNNKYRVVTLDGQLINVGGSFTGGSLAKNIGLISRKNEIERLKAEGMEIAEKLAGVDEELNTVRSEISAIEAFLLGARGELTVCREEKIRLDSVVLRIREQIGELAEEIERKKAEKERLIERIEDTNTEAELISKRLEEKRILHENIKSSLQTGMAGREEIENQIKALQDALNSINMDIMTAAKDKEVLAGSVEHLISTKETGLSKTTELKRAIEGYVLQKENTIKEAEALRAEAAALREETVRLAKETEAVLSKRLELEKKASEINSSEKDKLVERERLSGELIRLNEHKTDSQLEYDRLINRLYNEFNLTRTEAAAKGIVIDDVTKSAKRLAELNSQIKALGDVYLGAIVEYEEVMQRYNTLKTQIEDISKSKQDLEKIINDLTEQMKNIFSENFEKINFHFNRIFRDLFDGGKAELIITNPENVLESGIEISVQPPGKIIKHLSSLSGGEQALVAIAIYFAILKVRPSPFCVLDEIEAALDDVNVSRFAAYLRKLNYTQVIIITHRRGTMEEADRLYGVTMQQEGVSKLLKIDISEVEKRLGVSSK